MTTDRIIELLELPAEVAEELRAYKENSAFVLEPRIKNMLSSRATWDEGVKLLQAAIGDDPNGFKILRVMLGLACETYAQYEERGIPLGIFVDTMKFCTRFIRAHFRVYGSYRFVWAWWLPRQLALKEFRVGSLEYEFIEGDERIVSVHIPDDADLSPSAVRQSLNDFFAFRTKYFSDWENAKLYCESWLLSPSLQELLPQSSNIIAFQKLFTVERTDEESLAVLDWVFPGHSEVSARLPENTSLQKNMKAYLLRGGKVGWTRGVLKELNL